jgi:hypothetical protein
MNKSRYGMRKYMDDHQVMYEVIHVYENEKGKRGWNEAFAMGDDAEDLVAHLYMMVGDLKGLQTKQGAYMPDVISTLYEWWWTDTPDVKYSTGVREDDEETERVCAGL